MVVVTKQVHLFFRWIIAKYEVDTFPEVRNEEDSADKKFSLNVPCTYEFDREQSRVEIEVR